MRERTQVGIVGAGPAGLLLSHLLHLHGIESIVVEARSRAYVENRVRAGVLEHGSVDILREAGLDSRLRREGLVHEGIQIQIGEHRHRLDLKELTDGKVITVYGQQEVVKDLIARRLADKGAILFEAENAAVHDFEGERPRITFTRPASKAKSPATSSRAAMAFTASAGRPSRKARSRSTIASTPSPGSASSPRRRRLPKR